MGAASLDCCLLSLACIGRGETGESIDVAGVIFSSPPAPPIDSLPSVPPLRGPAPWKETTMGPLVTTDWLAAELGKSDLVVFDATKYLPNEPKEGVAEFLATHIPGARYFDIDQIADPDTDLPHMFPTPGRFAKLMQQLGVGNTSRIVFYDQKGLASAARGWWLMGLF